MSRFDVEANRPILTDIADGKSREQIAARYSEIAPHMLEAMARFVHKCQAQHRNAWKRWLLGDVEELHKLIAYYTPVDEVSEQLGRSKNAVEIKWHDTWDANQWENPSAMK